MGTGYTRNDTVNNIADGNVINASDLDGEFDAVQSAFDAATGHTHDGTTGEGAPIEVTGPAQEYVSTATELRPKTNNTYDLGSASLQWKDLYVDGTANLDTVDIDAGNIDGTTIGGTTPAAGTFTTATATTGNITTVNATTVDTTNIEVTNIKAKDGTAAGSIADSTGVVTLASSVLTTTDIDGGTIDGTVIGGSSAAAITGTTITGTSFVSSGDMTFGDNDKAIFGAGSDLEIYHDGSHSVIKDAGTGYLKLGLSDVGTTIQNAAGNNLLITSANDVSLNYAGSTKLATTNTGVDVTGTITSDGLTVQSGIADIRAGNIGPSTNPAVNIGRDDTSITGGNPLGYVQFLGSDNTAGSLTPHAYIGAIASGTHAAGSNPTELVFGTTAGSSETIVDRMLISSGGDISFYEDTGTTPKFFWDASAESLGIGTSSPSAVLHVRDNEPTVILDDANNGTGGTSYRPHQEFWANGTRVGSIGMTDSSNLEIIADNYNSASINFDTGGSERMRIDSSGRVGIGTTSPASFFSGGNQLVVGNGSGAQGLTIYAESTNHGQILFADGTTGNEAYRGILRYDHVTDSMQIMTAGATERMRIDSSGNVGIGTSSPEGNLHVLSSSAGTVTAPANFPLVLEGNIIAGMSVLTSNTGEGRIWFGDPDDNDVGRIEYAHSTNAMTFRTNASDRMTINSSGNVGIGTSSPATLLDARDGVGSILTLGNTGTFAGGESSYLKFREASTQLAEVGWEANTNELRLNNRIAGFTSFYTSNTERMRINASGNLLVGTTSSSGARITLESGVNQNAINMTSPTFNYNVATFHNKGTSGDNNLLAFGTEASFTTRGSITYNRAGGLVAYNTTSDYRAKDIAGPIEDASSTVLSLKPYMGTMKGATAERPMFVAHETQEVAPYAVTGEKDAVDQDGNPKYQQMDHSALVPLLTAALQEALTEIADLKARVAALEA